VILSNRGPVNLATLAALLDVQPSTTGRMVDRLVSAGLIDRGPRSDMLRRAAPEMTKGQSARRRTLGKQTAKNMMAKRLVGLLQTALRQGTKVSLPPPNSSATRTSAFSNLAGSPTSWPCPATPSRRVYSPR
jgi:MarR family